MTKQRMGRRLAISPVVVLLALSTTILFGSAAQLQIAAAL